MNEPERRLPIKLRIMVSIPPLMKHEYPTVTEVYKEFDSWVEHNDLFTIVTEFGQMLKAMGYQDSSIKEAMEYFIEVM